MGTTQTASQYELRQTQSFFKILLSQRNHKEGETSHPSLFVWKELAERPISTYVSEQAEVRVIVRLIVLSALIGALQNGLPVLRSFCCLLRHKQA